MLERESDGVVQNQWKSYSKEMIHGKAWQENWFHTGSQAYLETPLSKRTIDLLIFILNMLKPKMAWFSQFLMILVYFQLRKREHEWVWICELLWGLGKECQNGTETLCGFLRHLMYELKNSSLRRRWFFMFYKSQK